jgi:2-dehydropantoate 2-reductase
VTAGHHDEWPRVAVLGAGAVGCYFGGMLARAGAPVTLIGRARQVEALMRDGLQMETLRFTERVQVAASSDIAAARSARVVLLAVKTLDTEEAAKALAPELGPGAVVVSLQNGVDNVERIRRAAGFEAAPAVVYVAAEVTAPGVVKHTGRGDLILGRHPELSATFNRAGVPCRVSDNIEGELWAKLVMNCAYNAISAVTQERYGRIATNQLTRPLIRQIVEETLAVARAAGVRMPDTDLVAAAWTLGETMAGATSSTAQDLARGRRTEMDSLNGYVARRGTELGVATPANATLHALVRLLESR